MPNHETGNEGGDKKRVDENNEHPSESKKSVMSNHHTGKFYQHNKSINLVTRELEEDLRMVEKVNYYY